METIELDLTRVFVKVVQNGSFSRTAQMLKLPKSTVSKSISRLESETGTKLLLRTTRSLSLTAAGRAFFDATVGAISTLEDAQKSLYGSDRILNGQVRITAPEDLGSLVIAPIAAELALQNAGLGFELHYTDDVLDLVKDGFDLAVRVGRIAESRFKMKRVGEVVLIPIATKEYLKTHDKIRHPQDLTEHLCGSLNRQALLGHWTLRSSKGVVRVPIRARVSSNQMTSLLKVAQSGCGIALVPRYMAKPLLDSGELVRVLPEWSSPGLPVSVVTPLSPSSSARLKIAFDRVSAALSRALSST